MSPQMPAENSLMTSGFGLSRKFAALVICVAFVLVFSPSTSVAQDEQAQEPAAANDEEAAPAEAPADEGTPDATVDETESSSDGESTNFLFWMIEASGAFGAILLLLSFFMVALIMMNVMQVSRGALIPDDFLAEFENKLNGKDIQGAYDYAKSDDSLVARVLAAGMGRLNRGYSEAIEGMQEVGEEENMHMEHRLSYLALIASIAPMIGLMGTVYGMINSFEEIRKSAVAPKPKDLAGGISTALFTTLEGLAVAIPAMIAYSILRNRISRIMLEVGMVSEGLMSRFATVGKKPAAAAAPTAQAPAK